MRFLALDASTTHLGWALFDSSHLLSYGSISIGGGAIQNPAAIMRTAIVVDHLVQEMKIEAIILEEDLPGGRGRGGGFVDRALANIAGAIIAVGALRAVPVARVNNQTVKRVYQLPMRSDKEAAIRVASLIIHEEKAAGHLDEHAADAILTGCVGYGEHVRLWEQGEPDR